MDVFLFLPKYCRVGKAMALQELPKPLFNQEVHRVATFFTNFCTECRLLDTIIYYNTSDNFLIELPGVELHCKCDKDKLTDFKMKMQAILFDVRLNLSQDDLRLYIDGELNLI